MNICHCKRHLEGQPFLADAIMFVLSSITEALPDVFGLGTQLGIFQCLGFLSHGEHWGIFMVTSKRERMD